MLNYKRRRSRGNLFYLRISLILCVDGVWRIRLYQGARRLLFKRMEG